MSLGYGVEMSLTDKMVTGRLVSGRALVVEALYRRLITPRGSLGSTVFPEDLAYGFDVSGFVGSVGYERSAQVIGGMVVNELTKDDRVVSVTCDVRLTTQSDGTFLLLLDVAATLADEGEDFAFTLGVSHVATELLTAA